MEYWEDETLEAIAEQFGRLLMIDDHTVNLTKAKFARICIEMDLSKPLKRGLRVGSEDERMMMVVFYKRLSDFCFHCGRIGHMMNNSTFSSCSPKVTPVEVPASEVGRSSNLQDMQLGVARQRDGNLNLEIPGDGWNVEEGKAPNEDPSFGSWLVVQHRRGRGRGRGPGADPRRVKTGAPSDHGIRRSDAPNHVALAGLG